VTGLFEYGIGSAGVIRDRCHPFLAFAVRANDHRIIHIRFDPSGNQRRSVNDPGRDIVDLFKRGVAMEVRVDCYQPIEAARQ
jgi:hypothetical protein